MEELDASKAETIVNMLSDKENYKICEQAFENFGTKEIVVRLHDGKILIVLMNLEH